MELVRGFLWEKLNVRIDFPTSQGGKTSTGSVVRASFQRMNDDNKDFSYWISALIPCEYHQSLTVIYTNLVVILLIFNSDERIGNEKFTTLCRDTYELIIQTFPWVSITPTLHKVLAHSTQLIEEHNEWRSQKCFQEDCLDACHRHIQRYREPLARKLSYEAYMRDVYSFHFPVRLLLVLTKKANWEQS